MGEHSDHRLKGVLMPTRSIFAVLLLLLVWGCGSPITSAPVLPSTAAGSYQLGSGDEVRISVYGFDSLANTYLVNDEGAVSLPILGTVPVSGKSTAQAEQQIADALVARQLAVQPNVSVQIVKYRPFFILGEVQKPGSYAYVPGMSVLTAISIAGGHTFRANRKTYGISRTVNGSITKGKAMETTPVQPGDTVIIYEAWF
jgi:polysaccharide biosynthesis/export protein